MIRKWYLLVFYTCLYVSLTSISSNRNPLWKCIWCNYILICDLGVLKIEIEISCHVNATQIVNEKSMRENVSQKLKIRCSNIFESHCFIDWV